ncbi:MAG TPA: DUF2169 domain-containing protein [Desulfatiglandales bacterium]|nr:DUF2169 domain-containing protein [Desulfatiglandales bacterium]
MEPINQTPFHFGPIAGRLNFPGHSLTLIVKGTFDLKPGQTATPSEEHFFLAGDEFYTDDDEMQGSPRYEADFAYFKRRADLLLVGKCHAPRGKPIPACQVTFRVGEKSRSLAVFGDRYWKRNALGVQTITEPEPFTEMELRYENSFGGEDYKHNPVGKGYRKEETNAGKNRRLVPNIEAPDSLIASPRSRPQPAGFGPLGRMWGQRFSRMGTYKGKWLEERWPWFPTNFDWGHFNAAPPEMQLETYLRGDEALYFENLHPEYPQYKSRLPGLRVRCFVNTSVETETDQARFDEVSMVLDTLWVDMEAEKLVLVWRGWTEVLSEDYEEIRHLFIMSEPLEAAAQPADQCRGLFLAALAEYEAEWGMAPEEPEEPEKPETPEEPEETVAPEEPSIGPPELAADADAEAAAQKEKEALVKKVEAQTAAIFAQLGINLDGLPPEMQQKTKEQQAKIISKLTEGDPAKVMAMERAGLETQMKDTFAKMGVDINKPPAISAKAKAEQARFIKELGIDSSMVQGDPLLGNLFAAIPALLPKMGLDPENLDSLINEAKKQRERLAAELGIEEEEAQQAEEEQGPPLTREIVKERASRGDSFVGEDLHGLDLSALDLQLLDFMGANLAGVSLVKSNLSAANLEGADITGAVLSEAQLPDGNLSGTKLENANLVRANLTGATLTEANLSGADLTQAELAQANLAGALLPEALLSNANAAGSMLTSSDLSRANLEGANLEGADLSEATLTDAGLADANLSGANLTGAKLTGADLTKANLSGATLTGADLTGARLENADLTDADVTEGSLPDAKLTGAVLTDAVFEKARMTNAVLDQVAAKDAYFTEADLSGADFKKADLSGADFSKCLLHGADFLGANLTEVNIYGAQGTKVNFREANLTGLRASEGCDFTEGCFVKTSGPGAIWDEATLTGADFSFADMEGADFTKAVLENAKLYAANMKYSRFIKANLREAKLVRMNLFEGSFEKADLTEADLSGSNFYGAEFLDAVLDRTKLNGANVKMTKLAGKR